MYIWSLKCIYFNLIDITKCRFDQIKACDRYTLMYISIEHTKCIFGKIWDVAAVNQPISHTHRETEN